MKSVVCLVIVVCFANIVAQSSFHLDDFVIPGVGTPRANGTVCEHIPYMASIRLRSQDREIFGNGHFCGGVFISSSHVLTLASCLSRSTEMEVAEIEIIAGTRYRYDKTEAKSFQVKGYSLHPDYEKQNISNNVAIIFVSFDFNFIYSQNFLFH